MNFRVILFAISLLSSSVLFGQQSATIFGTLTDSSGNYVKEAIIFSSFKIKGIEQSVTTNDKGYFEITIPAERDVTVQFFKEGFKTQNRQFNLKPGERKEVNLAFKSLGLDLSTFNVNAEKDREKPMQTIDHRVISYMPNPSMNFESLLKAVGIGVSMNNELSSQYSVRGGNFDENLIYVNDVQIYRPFLVRSGQQEGLSFVNSDMVDEVSFSAGGWEAKYGDKLSSVLDVKYKEPSDFKGSVMASLQGVSTHIEGTSKNYRFTHITGLRYRSNQYILKSLDTDGDYKPIFADFQTYLTYDVSEKYEIGFLGNYAQNKYQFIPETRETDFGTINQALRLTVFFDGKELDQYRTWFGALTNTYRPNKNLKLNFNTSVYRSLEDETYDIIGAYRIDELERDLGKDNFGDVAFNRGVGEFQDHARNYLDVLVANIEHRGKLIKTNHVTEWGITAQYEDIRDELNEWERIDSADYSLPHNQDSVGYQNPELQPIQTLEMYSSNKSKATLISERIYGFAQRSWDNETKDSSAYGFTLGVRANYWTYNSEINISPRATFYLDPNWKRDFLFRLSGGFYYQPPFYRELRNYDGQLNPNIKSQRSIHAVLGSDYNFKAWNRPFKFVTEAYYKYMDNIIPYDIDNVRIRYYATNSAVAYATGIDFKLNGELVKDVESWINLSFMTTRENLIDDDYYEYLNSDGDTIIPGYTFNNVAVDSFHVVPGYIPRPTDQRVNFSMMFQDYLPKLPSLKMHLVLFFGTGLPFGQPQSKKYRNAARISPYQRVDLGFSYLLKKPDKKVKDKNPLKHFDSVWASLEVFNLLQNNNKISYLWVTDVTGRSYGVPNFLTNRQINFKLRFDF